DPAVLADLARGRRRAKLPHLRQALRGRLRPFQRVILRQLLAHSAFLDASLAQGEAARDERLRPDAQAVDRLPPSPGVEAPTAAPLVAERAVARTCFPSAGHLASWAGVCPGHKQSGGKRVSGKTRGGNAGLKAVRCEVVWAHARSHPSYRGAPFRRLSRR